MRSKMTSSVDLQGLAIDRSNTAQPKLRTRRHLVTRYVLPGLLLAGFVSLAGWASGDLLFPPAVVEVTPVVSTTSEVRQAGATLFKAAGWIEPRPTPVRVAALAPGVVERLLVVEDQPLKAGQPVAELVKDDARLAHERAQFDVALRSAELQGAQAQQQAAQTRFEQPVHLEASLSQADAALAELDTEIANLPFQQRRAVADQQAANADYRSKAALKNIVPEVEITIARSKYDAATALIEELQNRTAALQAQRAALASQRKAMQTQLTLLADEVRDRDNAAAQVKVAQAQLELARVAAAEAKLRLDRMTIRAPVDGRVYRLVGEPGARVGSGVMQMTSVRHDSSTIITMYQPEMLQVRVDVRFEDIPKVHLGQPVEIDNPALPQPLTGKVLFVSSEADIQKNTLQVKVALPGTTAVFKPEMLVDVTFQAAAVDTGAAKPSAEMKLFVPRNLVQRDGGEAFVWVADQSDGVARKTMLQLADNGSGDLVEVTGGLKVTSRIITSGAGNLYDGQRIRVAKVQPAGVNATAGGGHSGALKRLHSGGSE